MQRTFDTNVFGTMRRPSAALGVATPGSSLCSSVGTLINHIADVLRTVETDPDFAHRTKGWAGYLEPGYPVRVTHGSHLVNQE
jgi:hypothetical protein